MDEKKAAEMMARIQRRRDAITAAHTPENEERLRAEAEAKGMKLIKRRPGENGFALKLPIRQEIDGIWLAEVDLLINKIGG